MLSLGVTLLVSVAATPPPAAHAVEMLASTYDEAACDAADGGECADEVLIDLMPAPPALSTTSTSTPRRDSSKAVEEPTIPAPMMTASAVVTIRSSFS